MGLRIQLFVLSLYIQVLITTAFTNVGDSTNLQALVANWDKRPPNWKGSDPCGDRWDGIMCRNYYVISITLPSKGLSGTLSGDISALSKLETLDLSCNRDLVGPLPSSIGNLRKLSNLKLKGCGFNGLIPDSIGLLTELVNLLLSDNRFIGKIPRSLGNLTKLEILGLDNNQLNGTIPVSNEDSLGLDRLMSIKHFHMGMNQLTGSIPEGLFKSGMALIHVMFNGNKLTGPLPESLGLMTTLEEARFDMNLLNGTIPSNLNNLTNCNDMRLSNNKFSGLMPNLAGMNNLRYLDFSNNSFDASVVPSWFLTLPSLTTLVMENINLEGKVPVSLFSGPNLQNLNLANNRLNGSLDIGTKPNDRLQHVDLRGNKIVAFIERGRGIPNIGLILASNPICLESGREDRSYCTVPQTTSPYTTPTKSPVRIGVIIGVATGGVVVFLLLIAAAVYVVCQKQRAQTTHDQNPLAHQDLNKSSGGVPQLKGARHFSINELNKYTNHFSNANDIGSGGYGKVYRGILPNGKLIAVKRAQQGSMQGGQEFKTEIELLSRVHHKNLVSLLGFCFEQDEQMLIYEYVPNGSLRDSLSGKSGIRLDWMRRLKIALGAASGLTYLHVLANPPIIHRDVKSTNILLDEKLNAKIADFGLCKALGDTEKGYITTQVKGTMGYLDPEYYMTQQLTEKSDVYGFGVVMLELLTSRRPLERGKYIVREIRTTMDKKKDLYNLYEILDPTISLSTTLEGFEKFVDLAMQCVEESGDDRPTMGEVVKEIENIFQLAAMNPNAESTSNAASYDEAMASGESSFG